LNLITAIANVSASISGQHFGDADFDDWTANPHHFRARHQSAFQQPFRGFHPARRPMSGVKILDAPKQRKKPSQASFTGLAARGNQKLTALGAVVIVADR